MSRHAVAKVLTVALAVTGAGFSLGAGSAHAAGCTISSPVSWSQTSAGVACVEQTLKAAGYQSSYIDSYYGTVTVTSVAAFQRAHGLPVDGNTVDAATATAMGIWAASPVPPAPAQTGCTIASPVALTQTSAGVACVEQTLRAAGLQSTYIDSYYGTVTASAVAAFQRAHGLPVNGNTVDAATATAMGIWSGPAPLPAPPAAPQPAGCLQYAGTLDSNGVRVIKPGQYQTVAYAENPAGTRGDVVVVGDSLTWMTASDTAKALAQAGFRRVCVDGTISRTVEFGNTQVPDGLDAVARIKASDPSWASPDVKWVFALGTNDVGFSTSSPARASQYINDQIAAVGAHNQPIAWVNVRTARSSTWQAREGIWNQALVNSGVQVIDWASQFTRAEVGGDLVHFSAAGKTARVALLAAKV